MNSITLSRVDRRASSSEPWLVPATTGYPPTAAADDSNAQTRDWQAAAADAEPTFFYVAGASNEPSQIESDWASLAKAAQKRWLRENPF